MLSAVSASTVINPTQLENTVKSECNVVTFCENSKLLSTSFSLAVASSNNCKDVSA
jgi:hypothetical protein